MAEKVCKTKTGLLQVYKCEICGNVVEILHTGARALVCCKQPMNLLEEKTEEEGREKHLPVIEETDHGVRVTIGSTLHPMVEKHYIEWVEVAVGDKVLRKFLKPGDEPEATFGIADKQMGIAKVRAYCNVHGLWATKK